MGSNPQPKTPPRVCLGPITANSLPTEPKNDAVHGYVSEEAFQTLKDRYDAAYLALVDIRDAGRDATGVTDGSRRAQAALDRIAELAEPDTSKKNGCPA